jgi:hypothetical protein
MNKVTILSSRFLRVHVKLKLQKIVTLPAVLYGCESWSLIWKEEHWICDSKVLRKIYELEREDRGTYIMRSVIICIPHHMLLALSDLRDWDKRDIQRAWEKWKLHTQFLSKTWRLRDNFGDRRRWEDNIKTYLTVTPCECGNGFDWRRIGPITGCCVLGDELSASIRLANFLTNRVTINFSRKILHNAVS